MKKELVKEKEEWKFMEELQKDINRFLFKLPEEERKLVKKFYSRYVTLNINQIKKLYSIDNSIKEKDRIIESKNFEIAKLRNKILKLQNAGLKNALDSISIFRE